MLSYRPVSEEPATYFEDIQLGEEYVSPGRTVTEADIVIFAGLSGDYNVLHTDAEYMKTSIFGERIAHGLLGLSIQQFAMVNITMTVVWLGITLALSGFTPVLPRVTRPRLAACSAAVLVVLLASPALLQSKLPASGAEPRRT